MTVYVKDTASDVLEAIAKDLGGEYDVIISPLGNTGPGEPSNAEKFEYLQKQGRDFAAPSDAMRDAIENLLEESITTLLANNLPPGPAFEAMGEAVVEHIAERFKNTSDDGPDDLPAMPPLSDNYVKHDPYKKGSRVIGIRTGHLANSFVDAKVETRKVG